MQEPNNESTLPTKTTPPAGQTTPTRVARQAPPAGVPSGPSGPTIPVPAHPVKSRGPRRWPFILIGVLLVLVFGTAGAYLGYNSAIDLRKTKEAEQVITAATEHFYLGVEAMNNKNYALARQQFEYVIQLDPNFPGAAEKLTEVMMAQMATATPTTAPSPTPTLPTPTPDLRTQEEIYNQARQFYLNQDWDNLFIAIDSLRTVDPSYRAVEVDGMLYMALRYRGIRKIYQEANLEGGIYDLALAERIAPLDSEALAARNAARTYLNAITFWGADWARVIAMLEQVYPAMPNMRDASGLTAIERYRQALITQAAVLANAGDMCGAYEYYNKAISNFPDPVMEVTATAAYGICYPPTATPEPTGTPTPTPTGELPPVVVETPTVEPPPVVEETPTPSP